MRARKLGILLLLSVSLLGAACGNRVPHQEVAAAAGSSAAGVQQRASAVDGLASDRASIDESGVPTAVTGEGAALAAGTSKSSTGSRTAASTRAQTSLPGIPRGSTSGAKTPIVIGSVGTMSGLVGYAGVQGTAAVGAWVKMVNAAGGINGHPVKYLKADDGADPARYRALVQEFIERRDVIAFVYNMDEVSGQSSVQYITSKRVPVVGTLGGESWVYSSPMYFPQVSSGDNLFYLGLASAAGEALPKGKKKLATVVCLEAASCERANGLYPQYAKQAGFDLVYRAKASVAQPDFTAECLAARNAGADVMHVVMTYSNIMSIARSCTRQAYRPFFTTISSGADVKQVAEPSLEGMGVGLAVFPWFAGDTPATAEFQRAMHTFAASTTVDNSAATGWVAAKLFEKAARAGADPTKSLGVLEGLWSIRSDTLGGLTQPLNYIRDKPAPQRACWFTIAMKRGKFVQRGREIRCKG